jgi:hypothetical protein
VPAGAKKYFITFENIEGKFKLIKNNLLIIFTFFFSPIISFLYILEISKIQKVYQKYEEIIADLDYDKENDKLLINTSRIINLNYVKFC